MKSKCITLLLMLFLFVCAGFAQQKKETIAVMSLKGSSGITKDEAELLSDRLRAELFKTGMVDVMEREQMSEILKEQGFQQSGACTNESCLIEMGQILGVKKLVSGSIGKIGSMYLLNLRLIDIKTAKISKSVSEDIKGDLEDVVGRLARVAQDLFKPEQVRDVEKKERSREPARDEQKEQPDARETACDSRAIIEMTPFDQSITGFAMEETDWREAYGKLSDELSDYIKPGVETASQGALEKAERCKAIVIRTQLESYSTKPAKLGQKEGTIRMTFSFFDNPSAAQPIIKVTMDATGERHWKDVKPFVNACEEMGKKLGRQLEKSGELDRINGKK
jgi:hypothetical protein